MKNISNATYDPLTAVKCVITFLSYHDDQTLKINKLCLNTITITIPICASAQIGRIIQLNRNAAFSQTKASYIFVKTAREGDLDTCLSGSSYEKV